MSKEIECGCGNTVTLSEDENTCSRCGLEYNSIGAIIGDELITEYWTDFNSRMG